MQSIGVVGFGIFGNTVLGIVGAGFGFMTGAKMEKLVRDDKKIKMFQILKIIGLYSHKTKNEDVNEICEFTKNKLGIEIPPTVYSEWKKDVRNYFNTKTGSECNEAPAVLIYFEKNLIPLSS